MMSEVLTRAHRRELPGDAVAQIACKKDILLSKAIGIYFDYPEIAKRIETDPDEEIIKDEYIVDLIDEILGE